MLAARRGARTHRVMPRWLTEDEYRILSAVCDRLVPADDAPGALGTGVPEYIDALLGAFLVDPPRIWAGGPTSGRFGGEAGFARFHRLSAYDELAWRTRIEGSRGIPAREFNGPVVGLQERYRAGLGALGTAFCDLGPEEQDARLRADEAFTALVYEHCCEGMYGAPEYGGNRDGAGWAAIGYPGDVQPRGYLDDEVAGT
ncbi:MAG TPA: gluconate 2-dehydrogenase subunit 3 family protein [Acidimicrobiales bacterium]|nr:gluconate 2-dehydrogenase subunit 3 family protein [Acidimicrobiales bacterium]